MIQLLLGMAGAAEAALAFISFFGFIALLVMFVLACIGIFLRSRVAAVIAFALVYAATYLTTPWEAFRPVTPVDGDDAHWIEVFRLLACFWALVAIAAIAAVIVAFVFRRQPVVTEAEKAAEINASDDVGSR